MIHITTKCPRCGRDGSVPSHDEHKFQAIVCKECADVIEKDIDAITLKCKCCGRRIAPNTTGHPVCDSCKDRIHRLMTMQELEERKKHKVCVRCGAEGVVPRIGPDGQEGYMLCETCEEIIKY